MQIKVALVGISGYGSFYLSELLQNASEQEVRLVAGIDPYPERSPWLPALEELHIPIYADLETFYQHDTADLVLLAVPIHFHAPLTCLALAHGSNVLCEKPLGASMTDAQQMFEAERQSGKLVSIGYQWSFCDAIISLKRDILSGRLGRPLHLKTLLLWPRALSYYQRNDWAGKLKSDKGAWILDSPVNNATAHYLHNMLFLLGDTLEKSLLPDQMQVELYTANPIENYDTAALRLLTPHGVDLLFLTTHAVVTQRGPEISYEFENGVVEYTAEDAEFRVRFRNGTTKSYGNPEMTVYNKLWQTVDTIRSGASVVCGINTALPHLQCVLAAQKTPIHGFLADQVLLAKTEHDQTVWVKDLAEVFMTCSQSAQLPSELGSISWAQPAVVVNLR